MDYFSEKIEKLPEPATQIKCSFHFYRLPTAVGPRHGYLYYKKMKACLHLNNFRTKWEIVQEELYLFLTIYHLGLHLLPLKSSMTSTSCSCWELLFILFSVWIQVLVIQLCYILNWFIFVAKTCFLMKQPSIAKIRLLLPNHPKPDLSGSLQIPQFSWSNPLII